MSCIARTFGAPDRVPAGKTARSASSASRSGSEPPFDVAHEVEHVAVALDLHVLGDPDRPGPADPAEVVAAEVDEHHVLGLLLRVALELLGEELVLVRGRAARPRPGDRVGRQPVALDLEEQLGARPDDLERGRPDEEQVRARVHPSKRAVQADAVDRPAVGPDRQLERLAPGEHDLDRLAGGDRVLGDLDRPDVGVAAEARLDPRVGDRAGRPGVGDVRREPRGRAPATSSDALGRAVRSSASKIARSAIA